MPESATVDFSRQKMWRVPFVFNFNLWFLFLSTTSSLLLWNHFTMANSSSVCATRLIVSLSTMLSWVARGLENLWRNSRRGGLSLWHVLMAWPVICTLHLVSSSPSLPNLRILVKGDEWGCQVVTCRRRWRYPKQEAGQSPADSLPRKTSSRISRHLRWSPSHQLPRPLEHLWHTDTCRLLIWKSQNIFFHLSSRGRPEKPLREGGNSFRKE